MVELDQEELEVHHLHLNNVGHLSMHSYNN